MAKGLRTEAARLAERLNRVVVAFNHKSNYVSSSPVSSSGELQGSAVDFDIHCALFSAANDRLWGAINSIRSKEEKVEYEAAFAALSACQQSILRILESGAKSVAQLKKEANYAEDQLLRALIALTPEFVENYGGKGGRVVYHSIRYDVWAQRRRDAARLKEALAENTQAESPKKPGAVCSSCGKTATVAEHSSGESSCCHAAVVAEEEFAR